MINGGRPKPGPSAGRKSRKVGSARARRCFPCARACLLHGRGANSNLRKHHPGIPAYPSFSSNDGNHETNASALR